jgi:hypothetical protein
MDIGDSFSLSTVHHILTRQPVATRQGGCLWPLLYLSRQVEKKEFTLEEYYGVQLHVVDYNLECCFFCLTPCCARPLGFVR